MKDAITPRRHTLLFTRIVDIAFAVELVGRRKQNLPFFKLVVDIALNNSHPSKVLLIILSLYGKELIILKQHIVFFTFYVESHYLIRNI